MRLSKRSEYGIKAVVYLAVRYGSGYIQSKEISQAEQLPAKFLESILLSLRSAGILESKVGAGGGYRLSRAPEQILVLDLINALEPSEATVQSLHYNGAADSSNNGEFLNSTGRHALSALHERIEDALASAIGRMSLAEVVTLAEQRSENKENVMYYI